MRRMRTNARVSKGRARQNLTDLEDSSLTHSPDIAQQPLLYNTPYPVQVEGTQNEKKEEQESVKEEKEGLDMNEDFEGALEDVEKEEGEEGEEDEGTFTHPGWLGMGYPVQLNIIHEHHTCTGHYWEVWDYLNSLPR